MGKVRNGPTWNGFAAHDPALLGSPACPVRPSMTGDPLAALDRQVDSSVFRLVPVHALGHGDGPTGRQQHHGPVTMHLVLAPASMQSQMDERKEFFVEGRIGALRIPDSRIVGRTPDQRTIWSFRSKSTRAGTLMP